MKIALLTDFGTKDYFVAAMKGVIFSINENAEIIDISHEIEPQDVRSASFTLGACFREFPKGTIFVSIVDPGVGSVRRPIVVATERYIFVAPDNGILSSVFEACEAVSVFESTNEEYFKKRIGNTFHGRDVFAPVAAHLSLGVKPEAFGKRITDFIFSGIAKPKRLNARKIQGEIIHVDRFGNLITNLTRDDLREPFVLTIGQTKITKLNRFFAESERGELLMIYGSAGFLEICAFSDSAQRIMRSNVGKTVIAEF